MPTENSAYPELPSPLTSYRQRLDELAGRESELAARDRVFVKVRIGLFVIGLLTLFLCVGSDRIHWWWLLIPVAGFLTQLPAHARCLDQLQRIRLVRQFHADCILRINRSWQHRVNDGADFLDPMHPWALDLDLFGRGSLFQMINECRTEPGRRRLAEWLTTVPDAGVITVRQKRSVALRNCMELREELAAIPDTGNWKLAERVLSEWCLQPAAPIPRFVLVASGLLGLVSLPVMLLAALELIPFSAAIAIGILQSPLILVTRHQIRLCVKQMDSVDESLSNLSLVIGVLESVRTEDRNLRGLLDQLQGPGGPASVAIRRLSRLTGWLNNATRNQFVAPFAWICGLLVWLTHALELWRTRYAQQVASWLSATAELEATVSIAAFGYEHPDFCMPELAEHTPGLEATQLGHVLLPPSACVRNNVSLNRDNPLLLISGSNMSGKSTLLRSIGTNLVLACCGAVVCAERFRMYPFQIATAMRMSDSLQEGRSLFMSVLQRLKSVIDLTTGERTVLFLLDEILHGTNSHDRRRGAEAVIRTLVDRGAMGLVTTHDLALTRIVDDMQGRARNMHFEDQVNNGEMTFDYQLRDGVVQRSNAIELMRMMGLEV